jgi:hypothetical protein
MAPTPVYIGASWRGCAPCGWRAKGLRWQGSLAELNTWMPLRPLGYASTCCTFAVPLVPLRSSTAISESLPFDAPFTSTMSDIKIELAQPEDVQDMARLRADAIVRCTVPCASSSRFFRIRTHSFS